MKKPHSSANAPRRPGPLKLKSAIKPIGSSRRTFLKRTGLVGLASLAGNSIVGATDPPSPSGGPPPTPEDPYKYALVCVKDPDSQIPTPPPSNPPSRNYTGVIKEGAAPDDTTLPDAPAVRAKRATWRSRGTAGNNDNTTGSDGLDDGVFLVVWGTGPEAETPERAADPNLSPPVMRGYRDDQVSSHMTVSGQERAYLNDDINEDEPNDDPWKVVENGLHFGSDGETPEDIEEWEWIFTPFPVYARVVKEDNHKADNQGYLPKDGSKAPLGSGELKVISTTGRVEYNPLTNWLKDLLTDWRDTNGYTGNTKLGAAGAVLPATSVHGIAKILRMSAESTTASLGAKISANSSPGSGGGTGGGGEISAGYSVTSSPTENPEASARLDWSFIVVRKLKTAPAGTLWDEWKNAWPENLLALPPVPPTLP